MVMADTHGVSFKRQIHDLGPMDVSIPFVTDVRIEADMPTSTSNLPRRTTGLPYYSCIDNSVGRVDLDASGIKRIKEADKKISTNAYIPKDISDQLAGVQTDYFRDSLETQLRSVGSRFFATALMKTEGQLNWLADYFCMHKEYWLVTAEEWIKTTPNDIET